MDEKGQVTLTQMLRQAISIIENDDDCLGNFFNDGILTFSLTRTHTSLQDITQYTKYSFTITQDRHGGTHIDECHIKETIMDDNNTNADTISALRVVELEKSKTIGDEQ